MFLPNANNLVELFSDSYRYTRTYHMQLCNLHTIMQLHANMQLPFLYHDFSQKPLYSFLTPIPITEIRLKILLRW